MLPKKLLKDIVIFSKKKFNIKSSVYKVNFIYVDSFDKLKDYLNDYYLIIIDVRLVNEKECLKYFRKIKPKAYIVLYSPEEISKTVFNSFYQFVKKIDENIINLIIKGANNYYYLAQKYIDAKHNLEDLNSIGISLTSEKSIPKLLDLILFKSRELTRSDAGSLYIVEKENNKKVLRFKLTHCDSIKIPFKEYTIPINKESIAGYVALTGKILNIENVNEISSVAPYKFNKEFDIKSGYRTVNMLVIPMKNNKDEVIGVLQLINRKKNKIKLTNSNIEKNIIPYDSFCEELSKSLAAQASVAYENSKLYEDINNLFESFVTASVIAIEARDPITNGHSLRVAELSVKIAKAINEIKTGRFKNIKFNEDNIKELRYASILHDFGKIGVRENILTKQYKLYSEQINSIILKFELLKYYYKNNYMKRIMKLIRSKKDIKKITKEIKELTEKLKEKFAEINNYKEVLRQINESTYLDESYYKKLEKIKKLNYKNAEGKKEEVIKDEEYEKLKIKKGTLDEKERVEIESHVEYSYKFLKEIKWTSNLEQIPKFAYMHHERLDGSGYPNKLKGDKIALQARIIAVADVFDAIVAWDRPYKKAIAIDKALKILKEEAEKNKLDKDIVDIFIEKRLYHN